MLKEIELQKDYFNSSPFPSGRAGVGLSSVYFGGGTPSLLSEKEINIIFNKLTKYFEIKNDAEITLEANPDDLTKEYLKELKNTPVNRLSIGIQSFSDDDLSFMNRAHDSNAALHCVAMAAEAGYENLTIDLIYGMPTMSNETWIKNLQTAFAMPVNHLSCYSLTVEPKTTLAKMIIQKKVGDVSDQKSAEQFELLLKLTGENNFEQYEISNFCRKEKYAIHNSNYWKGESYLGVGPSAHSYNGFSRQWNVANNSSYIKSLANNKLNFQKEELTTAQKYNEYVLTSLRTKWGTSVQKIKENFGGEFEKYFNAGANKFLSEKMLIEKSTVFYLTEKGKLFADKIASDLFYISLPSKIKIEHG